MASMADVMTGLKILIRHSETSDEVCAEHDIIYAAHDVDKGDLSDDELEQLDEAGWFWDEDPEAWAIYV